MKWFELFAQLIAIAEETYKAIADAMAAGKAPADVHQVITDHAAELPAKIRGV